MSENFDWSKFEKDETARILSEMEAVERDKPQNVAVCPNNADESTFEAFSKASSSIIDLFAEKTRNIR